MASVPVTHLVRQLQCDLRSGQIELPALPELTFRIRQSLYNSQTPLDQIARLVQLDPTLATRLIQMANSASYAGTQRTTHCRGAITKLGLTVTRNLITSLTLKQAYQRQRNQQISQLVKAAWLQSCRIGAMAQVLSSLIVGIPHDEAMLAGMVHNIGLLPLVNYLERYPNWITPKSFQAIAHQFQAPLGLLLLKAWHFEERFWPIPQQSNQLNYESGKSQPNLVDLVLVARVHLHLNANNQNHIAARLKTMPAYHKLPISRLGIGASLELINQSKIEMEQLIRQLQ